MYLWLIELNNPTSGDYRTMVVAGETERDAEMHAARWSQNAKEDDPLAWLNDRRIDSIGTAAEGLIGLNGNLVPGVVVAAQ